MNISNIKLVILAAAATLLCSSCIREELPPCPPLQVDVVVKDKNYFNAAATDGIEPVRPENLPFREYVSTVYYRLDDAETGEMVLEQTNTVVAGDADTYAITFPESLPFGRYILTVWGNMHSPRPLADDALYTEVTQYHAAENDIYTTVDTLDYDVYDARFTAELERAKGKLIVMAENMPEDVDFSTKDIDAIYQYIGRGLRYGGETEFHTDTLWDRTVDFSTGMLLCPSTGHDATTLDVNFYRTAAGAQQQPLEPEDINITMSRNEVTIVRYVYDDGKPGDDDLFNIFILVDDNWEEVHSMVID